MLITQQKFKDDVSSADAIPKRLQIATADRIQQCKNPQNFVYEQCPECGKHSRSIPISCFVRYCPNCIDQKFGRSIRRLDVLMRNYSGTCKHLTLTMPRSLCNRESKNRLEKYFRKLMDHLRRTHGYQFEYVAVYDYGTFRSENPFETNPHIHVAINMIYTIPQKHLLEDWNRIIADQLSTFHDTKRSAYLFIKKSRTQSVKRYFARRIAGILGNKPDTFTLADRMTVEDYNSLIRGSRLLKSFTIRRFSSNVVHICGKRCLNCGAELIYTFCSVETAAILEESDKLSRCFDDG